MRKLGGRKGTRVPMTIPQDRNLCWSLESGRRFRIPSLVGDFTRECLGLAVETSLTGLRVVRELDRIAGLCMIVSDNGTDLTQMPSWHCKRNRG